MFREIVHNEWLTIFISIGLLSIALTKYLYENRFYDFIGIFGNSKYLKIYEKDHKFIDSFHGLLSMNLIISVSTFAYISYNYFAHQTGFNLLIYLQFLGVFASLILLKMGTERGIGALFSINKLTESYLFQKLSYKNYIGIILLPINALLIYTIPTSGALIISLVALVVGIYIVGYLMIIKRHQSVLFNNLFYFILYLCAFEVGPYLILYKIIIQHLD